MRNTKPTPPPIIAEIQRLLRLGCTYRDIAWQVGVGIATVARVAGREPAEDQRRTARLKAI